RLVVQPGAAGTGLSAGQQLGTGRTPLLDVGGDDVQLLLIDDGADIGACIQRITDDHVADTCGDRTGKLVGDRALYDQSAARVAALADVQERTEDCGVDGSVHIRVGEHDLRVLAPAFELYLPQRASALARDVPTHTGGPGEREHVDIGMRADR